MEWFLSIIQFVFGIYLSSLFNARDEVVFLPGKRYGGGGWQRYEFHVIPEE
jgi:hypothetical protein